MMSRETDRAGSVWSNCFQIVAGRASQASQASQSQSGPVGLGRPGQWEAVGAVERPGGPGDHREPQGTTGGDHTLSPARGVTGRTPVNKCHCDTL